MTVNIETGTNLTNSEVGSVPVRPAPRDADEVAKFVQENARVIRHRFRCGLSPQLQRMVETGDILSTVFRRTQGYLQKAPLQSETTGGMWRLVELITRRAAVHYGRRHSAARRAEGQWWRQTPPPTNAGDLAAALRPVLGGLDDPFEQELVRLRATGLTHTQIAASMGVSEDAVRQRWSRLRRRVIAQWKGGPPA